MSCSLWDMPPLPAERACAAPCRHLSLKHVFQSAAPPNSSGTKRHTSCKRCQPTSSAMSLPAESSITRPDVPLHRVVTHPLHGRPRTAAIASGARCRGACTTQMPAGLPAHVAAAAAASRSAQPAATAGLVHAAQPSSCLQAAAAAAAPRHATRVRMQWASCAGAHVPWGLRRAARGVRGQQRCGRYIVQSPQICRSRCGYWRLHLLCSGLGPSRRPCICIQGSASS